MSYIMVRPKTRSDHYIGRQSKWWSFEEENLSEYLSGRRSLVETEKKRKRKWKKRSLLFIASWLWSSLYLSDIEIADRVLQLCIEF